MQPQRALDVDSASLELRDERRDLLPLEGDGRSLRVVLVVGVGVPGRSDDLVALPDESRELLCVLRERCLEAAPGVGGHGRQNTASARGMPLPQGRARATVSRMRSVVNHVTFDCRDPYSLAVFWASAVHGHIQDDDLPGDPAALVTHAGTPLLFEQVPDDKAIKNRVHLDLMPVLPRAEEVARLVALGARVIDDRTRADGSGWVVMADPEGNEFCVERSLTERGQREHDDLGWREMPPVRTADERSMLEAMLEWYREGVLRKVEGMSQADATRSALRSPTTAAGIVKHLAVVEDLWFTVRLGGQPMPEPWRDVDFSVDPDWEFRTATQEPLETSVALYVEACARSRAAVAGRSLDDVGSDARRGEFSLRWALLHMIEETARHLGHLDVLRELADGTTGG